MANFEAGMESMVDMYIFETTSLLDQLDQILMKTESEAGFSSEEINAHDQRFFCNDGS